nr:hypothetical protein Itr_chr11CG15440 [Ipomoea trifida]
MSQTTNNPRLWIVARFGSLMHSLQSHVMFFNHDASTIVDLLWPLPECNYELISSSSSILALNPCKTSQYVSPYSIYNII